MSPLRNLAERISLSLAVARGAPWTGSFELLVKLDPGGIEPSRANPEDAGYDLFAPDDVILEAGARMTINTRVRVAPPPHLAVLVVPKSGLAARHGITIVNSPGLVDPGYREPIGVVLQNTGDAVWHRAAGASIAQLLLVPFLAPTVSLRDVLPAYGTRVGGFGSTDTAGSQRIG